jgi:DNA-binding NarL/FixJ family response regulator
LHLRISQLTNGHQNMRHQSPTCAILADRHTALSEGIRGLLETTFRTVYTVADEKTLKEGAQRLLPALIVLDLSLEADSLQGLLEEIRELSPDSPVMVLSVHDEAAVARTALACGAQSVVLKRTISTDFLAAVNAILRGEQYISPGFGLNLTVN